MTFIHRISLLFFGVAASMSFSSCEDRIEVDFPKGDTYLVVEAFLTTDERPHDFLLTYTQPFFDQDIAPIATGAVVFLRDDEGNESLLQEVEPGVYRFPEAGIVGVSYQLEINLPDDNRYVSDWELMREIPPILDIRSEISPRGPSEFLGEEPGQIYEVLIDAFEPPGIGDFYRWRTVLNGIPQNTPLDIFVASDELVDGNPIVGFNPTNSLYFAGDTVTIIQERISGELFRFLSLVLMQTGFVGGLFDTPAAPINGNIANTNPEGRVALGFFAATARDAATVIAGE